MNKLLWHQAQKLFEQSLTLDEPARSNFIANNTTGQDDLRQLLESMLLAEQDDTFMQSMPSVEVNEVLNNDAVQVFGHFTLIKKIAVGGMGRIYKARSNLSDVVVFQALKLIRRELLSDEMLSRFNNEKSILGKLKHHHIAALIDAGVVDETPYLATEWIDGESINEYVNNNKLSVDQVLGLFLQACEAVAYAHAQLVIHRDLKPANILVDRNKQVKLLDFGIAKLIDGPNAQMTQTQVFTPDYAAPEQINGEACTTATDIYALGVLLFEMLVGDKRFGFEGLSMSEKVKAIAQPKTVFASQVMQQKRLPQAHKIKGALDTIINQAMHADPNRRYTSVFEMISDIKRYQQHLPIKAMGDGLIYRGRMFFKRNLWSSILTMLLVLSLTAGMLYSNVQKQQAVQAQLMAQNEADKSQQMLNFFMTVLETASPLSGGSTQITVQQMFENGAEKFNLDSIEDEIVKAEIAGQVAEIYGELSENDLKIKYNQIALKYYQTDIKEHATKFLYHHLNIALAYRDQERGDQALGYLTEVYDQVKGFDIDQRLLAEVMINFGQLNRQSDPTQALSYLYDAENIALELNDVESLGKVKYYQYLILQDQLPPTESELYLLQAQQYFEQVYGSHPDLLSVRNSLGIKYKNEGQYFKANDLYEVIHADYMQLYGEKNINHLTNHANVSFALGDFNKAALLTKESLQIIEDNEIEEGFSSLAAVVVHARSLSELGHFEEAKSYLLKAISYFKPLFDDDHVVMFTLRSYWLDLLVKANQIEAYDGDVNELIELARLQLNESLSTKRKFVTISIIVATYHWVQNDYQQAHDLLKTAQDIMQEISLKQSWEYWFITAGVIKLNENLYVNVNSTELSDSLAQLFMLIPQNHWYHSLFEE
jgi:serine/threonine-protein kinase